MFKFIPYWVILAGTVATGAAIIVIDFILYSEVQESYVVATNVALVWATLMLALATYTLALVAHAQMQEARNESKLARDQRKRRSRSGESSIMKRNMSHSAHW